MPAQDTGWWRRLSDSRVLAGGRARRHGTRCQCLPAVDRPQRQHRSGADRLGDRRSRRRRHDDGDGGAAARCQGGARAYRRRGGVAHVALSHQPLVWLRGRRAGHRTAHHLVRCRLRRGRRRAGDARGAAVARSPARSGAAADRGCGAGRLQPLRQRQAAAQSRNRGVDGGHAETERVHAAARDGRPGHGRTSFTWSSTASDGRTRWRSITTCGSTTSSRSSKRRGSTSRRKPEATTRRRSCRSPRH